MTDLAPADLASGDLAPGNHDHGTLAAPDILIIERILPGPVERVWAFLTDSDKRRQWLAAGDMDLTPGAPFTLVWRNDKLDPPSRRPDGFPEEHSLECRIVAVEAPRRLVFKWGTASDAEVVFELEPRGDRVHLRLTHRRVAERATLVNVSAGWHAHLAVLVAKLNDTAPPPFWDTWSRLKADYEARVPAG